MTGQHHPYFISYSRDDTGFVRRLAGDLKDKALDWIKTL